jgi:hypothetical protein
VVSPGITKAQRALLAGGAVEHVGARLESAGAGEREQRSGKASAVSARGALVCLAARERLAHDRSATGEKGHGAVLSERILHASPDFLINNGHVFPGMHIALVLHLSHVGDIGKQLVKAGLGETSSALTRPLRATPRLFTQPRRAHSRTAPRQRGSIHVAAGFCGDPKKGTVEATIVEDTKKKKVISVSKVTYE